MCLEALAYTGIATRRSSGNLFSVRDVHTDRHSIRQEINMTVVYDVALYIQVGITHF